MQIKKLEPIPAGSNPFHHDIDNMGQTMGTNCMIMHGNHSDEVCNALIIINTLTGERIKVIID